MKKFLLTLLAVLTVTGLTSCEMKPSPTDQSTTHTHEWGEPTVAANGDKIYACTDCGETKTETHAHSFSTDWTSDAAQHWHACTAVGCSERKDNAAHVWGEPVTVLQPTSSTEGKKEYSCTVCQRTRQESIAPLPAKMAEADWIAAFDLENVRIDCHYTVSEEWEGIADEESVYLVDGELVVIRDADGDTYVDRTALAGLDFSAFYDQFDHHGEGVYKSAFVSLEDALGTLDDVEIFFENGKIACITYEVDTGIFGRIEYEYSFSLWGEVSLELPTLTEEELAAAFDAENFENYTANIYDLPAEEEYYEIILLIDGDAYYKSTVEDFAGDPVEESGTLADAGVEMILEVMALAELLDAEKFEYDIAAMGFAYTETIEDFMGTGNTVAELYLSVENGLLSFVELYFDDGSEISFYFEEYGTTVVE
ncbi:MAG: hypothetical protein IJW16_00705 [Clostridia bacterium]|nr:hypothetical protein [Clostridia bacterium]